MMPRTEEWLVLAVLAVAYFSFGAVEPWSWALVCAFIAAAAVFVAPYSRFDNPIGRYLVPGILAIGAVGFTQQLNPRSPISLSTFGPSTASSLMTARSVSRCVAYALFLWASGSAFGRPKAARRALWSLFFFGVCAAMIGLAQKSADNQMLLGLRRATRSNPFGPIYNSDHAAAQLMMSLLVGAGLFIGRATAAHRRGSAADFWSSQVVVFVGLVIIAVGLGSTGSRGAFAGACAGLAAAGAASAAAFPSSRRMSAALAVIVLVGYVWAVAHFPHMRGINLDTGALDTSTRYRVSMYRSAAVMFFQRPVFGWGLGSIQAAFPAYQDPSVHGLVQHVHSDWLEFAAETGFVGLLILFAAVGTFAARSWSMWRRCEGSNRWLAAGACAAIFAMAFHEGVDFAGQTPLLALFGLALVAAMNGLLADETPAASTNPLDRSRFSLGAVLAALLVLGPFRSAAAWVVRARAESLPDMARVGELQEAARIEEDPADHLDIATLLLRQYDKNRNADLLDRALREARIAGDENPLDPFTNQALAAALWRLGRPVDADRYEVRSKALTFWAEVPSA